MSIPGGAPCLLVGCVGGRTGTPNCLKTSSWFRWPFTPTSTKLCVHDSMRRFRSSQSHSAASGKLPDGEISTYKIILTLVFAHPRFVVCANGPSHYPDLRQPTKINDFLPRRAACEEGVPEHGTPHQFAAVYALGHLWRLGAGSLITIRGRLFVFLFLFVWWFPLANGSSIQNV